MGVRISVDGRPLLTADSYTVQEDSTPINPADETGGTSQINFSVPTFPGWRSIEDLPVLLRDDTQGITAGTATTVSEQNGKVQITADSRILQLSATRTAQPYRGTLGGAIRYYLSLVGITSDIVIESAIAAMPVVFPGWNDDVYQRIAKKLCPAFGIEMSLVSNNIVFRAPRQTKAVLLRLVDLTESIDTGSRAQRSKLTWYGTSWVDTKLVYPPGGSWNSDVEVFDVNSGEVKVYETVELSSSVQSIVQPTCVLNVGPGDTGASVYTVAGTDGLPIQPDMWRDYGGDLRVEINEDTRSLKVTIRGMDFPEYGPFQIAVTSGDGGSYSTLRILGTGVVLDPHVVDLGTGLTVDQAPAEYSDDVDNDFIIGNDQAYSAAAWQNAAAGGPAQTVSFSAAGINRASDSGSTAYATTNDWDTEYAGMTTDGWDALWAAQALADFDAFWQQKVGEEFRNQAFGNVAGARIIHDASIYRIRSASNAQGLLQGQAEIDNTVGDFDTYYAGMTTDDWDLMWSGATHKQFNVAPFPEILTDGTRPAPRKPVSVYPSDTTFPSSKLFPNG